MSAGYVINTDKGPRVAHFPTKRALDDTELVKVYEEEVPVIVTAQELNNLLAGRPVPVRIARLKRAILGAD